MNKWTRRLYSGASLDTSWGLRRDPVAEPRHIVDPVSHSSAEPEEVQTADRQVAGQEEPPKPANLMEAPRPSKPIGSPYPVLTHSQAAAIAGLLVVTAGFALFSPLACAIAINGILVTAFSASNLLKLVLLRASQRHRVMMEVSQEELKQTSLGTLPLYTIMVPLYHEAVMVPSLLAAIDGLNYPKGKLDIKFLLEADDAETREAVETADLPTGAEILIVPNQGPRGKPRACNVGLSAARGSLLVIYDAEDRPEPDQLLKVVAAFGKMPSTTICLQAKLNYYNRTQNLLTRWAAAEYSSWFDLLLPGLQSLDVAMPLGGTSNHFATSGLRRLGGWEPYNVTEDADLGVRLFTSGFKTAMIDSTTYEEANSRYGNWLRQHSRWIKGYLQTYLAHMRHPILLYRQMGIRAFLIFQLFFGVGSLCLLFNPIYWLVTIVWYTSHLAGIQSVFPPAILYPALIGLFIGNFSFLLTTMAGCLVRRHYGDVKWVLLSPLYWALISLAAWKALYQLIVRPYYWEKTTHGLFHEHALLTQPRPSEQRPSPGRLTLKEPK